MKRVLVIDDEPGNAVILEAFLEDWGIEVDAVENLVDANGLVHNHSYDAYFLDAGMNQFIGDKLFSWRIQERHGERCVPLIWHSGRAREDYPGPNEGYTDCLKKPWTPNELYDVLVKAQLVE